VAERGDPGDVSVRAEPLEPTGLVGETLPATTGGPRSFSWWGMVWLILTESALFATLILSYFYLRFRSSPSWPPGGIEDPSLGLPLVMSAILWSSSVPVHLADRGIRRGSQGALRWGLAAGWVLGVTFIALQLAVEYPELLREFTPRTNSYGSLFFTITGFHALHVVIGLVMSGWVQARAWRGAFDRYRHVSVQNFAMYWHFVDTVWLFVLLSLYVSPNL
jgi:heme/copper-type cytochrome/quinol oxidase subunit 3